MSLAIIGVGIGMMACMSGWNAAAHRKDERTASLMSILFYLCTASLLGALIKIIFFGG
jgi:Na+/melibiose symporter-like transporter